MTLITLDCPGARVSADLRDPLPLAIPMDFNGAQPSHFAAPPAAAAALHVPGFVGDTRAGGSCNCEELRLVPHCNGTHTECVGHVTDERVAISEVLRGGLFLALLVSVRPQPASATAETTVPPPSPEDLLVTASALAGATRGLLPAEPTAVGPRPPALVVRTLPNGSDKLTRRYQGPSPAPYFSREAADWVVAQGIDHLVLDLPSMDRAQDGGQLTAHRRYWGLPPGSRHLADSRRPQATITELAWIAPTLHDGWYLLDLQVPAFLTDAVPSRPLLYRARLT
jgi:kynurenine formamidase